MDLTTNNLAAVQKHHHEKLIFYNTRKTEHGFIGTDASQSFIEPYSIQSISAFGHSDPKSCFHQVLGIDHLAAAFLASAFLWTFNAFKVPSLANR